MAKRPTKNEFLELVKDIPKGKVEARGRFGRDYDLFLVTDDKEIQFGTIPALIPYGRHENYNRIDNVVEQYQGWLDGGRKSTKAKKTAIKLNEV